MESSIVPETTRQAEFGAFKELMANGQVSEALKMPGAMDMAALYCRDIEKRLFGVQDSRYLPFLRKASDILAAAERKPFSGEWWRNA